MQQDWLTEPDEDRAELHGLRCIIKRVLWSGHLCGYVGVPKDHPLFGKGYSDIVIAPKDKYHRKIDVDEIGAINLFIGAVHAQQHDNDKVKSLDLCVLIDCHGGLTYSGDHAPGEAIDGLWWFGFDCAHVGDYMPRSSYREGIYRNMVYVRNICSMLAEQLASWPTQEQAIASWGV